MTFETVHFNGKPSPDKYTATAIEIKRIEGKKP